MRVAAKLRPSAGHLRCLVLPDCRVMLSVRPIRENLVPGRSEMTRKLLCLFTLMLAMAVAAAADTVVFSDFGPGNSYDTSTGWTLGGPNSPVCCQEIAMQFTPG